MSQSDSIQHLMQHLVEEASQKYSANAFTLDANPKRGTVGITFKVPYDTPAKRPAAPPEQIRPERWDQAVAQVLTEAEYDRALARISELLGAEAYSPEDEELDRVSKLVETYEATHHPMEAPDDAAMLEFLLDQRMISKEQLLPLAGGSESLDAMLAGQTAVNAEVAQAVREHSGS